MVTRHESAIIRFENVQKSETVFASRNTSIKGARSEQVKTDYTTPNPNLAIGVP